MNIQQLEYIVAVEEYQHFGKGRALPGNTTDIEYDDTKTGGGTGYKVI